MPVEVELKLTADGPAPLDRLAAADELGPARLGDGATVDELDRYLDTADGRLAAAAWACRLRTRDGRTIVSLKGPAETEVGADGLHRRPELEGPAAPVTEPATWPPSAARDFVEELAGGRPLLERLALAQRRIERPVLVDDGPIGTLSLDHVEVRHADRPLGEMWIVELELAPGQAETSLAGLATALAAVDGLTPDPTTKLERALLLLDRAASTR